MPTEAGCWKLPRAKIPAFEGRSSKLSLIALRRSLPGKPQKYFFERFALRRELLHP
jgi:hypothetical protein